MEHKLVRLNCLFNRRMEIRSDWLRWEISASCKGMSGNKQVGSANRITSLCLHLDSPDLDGWRRDKSLRKSGERGQPPQPSERLDMLMRFERISARRHLNSRRLAVFTELHQIKSGRLASRPIQVDFDTTTTKTQLKSLRLGRDN